MGSATQQSPQPLQPERQQHRRAVRIAFCVMAFSAYALSAAAPETRSTFAQDDQIEKARALVLRGRYAEARELYAELSDEHPIEVALGLARCHVAVGERKQAIDLLSKAIATHAEESRLIAALAELEFASGNYRQAQEHVDSALSIDNDCLLARWLDAELLRTSGKLDEAARGYEWFVDYYNGSQQKIATADDMHLIGRGAAQFARWNRLHDQFSFLINTLYPDILHFDENYWPVHLDKARLFIEKFNAAEAERALVAGLRINPNAAELHAARASLAIQSFDFETALPALKRALEINPQLAEAHRLMADIHLANFRTAEAIASLEEALAIEPRSEATLGRLAAIYLIGQGLDPQQASKNHEALTAEVTSANSHPGEFYFVLAETLNSFRRWPQAREFYRAASTQMPQLIGPRAALGMMHMRLGEEAEARVELEAAFKEDPFNVRVKNMLEVLDVLDGYTELKTEHFIFKYDEQHDAILASYLPEFMEHAYPELCHDFGYEPPDRSLFEIFNQAKNTSGHGWFSARMIGLPYVGTVGACAGQMVAMTSPDSMNSKFNWARVVRHEFVHVLNLQQTNFNVPHWFTEGLAVEAEGYPRSELWDQLLASRVPTGEVFNLDDINFGFIRPSSQLEWHLAYCQAELYVQFMREEFAEQGPAEMLQAYADNLTTAQAIERCFGISQEEFESRYTKYLRKIMETLPSGLTLPGEERSFAEIDRAARANPNDPDALAELAEAYLLRQEYPNARKFADAAIGQRANHQQASYVLARLAVVTGERDKAYELLDAAIDPQEPYPAGIQLLSALHCAKQDFVAAEKLVLAAQAAKPDNRQWTEDLAAIYLRSGDDAKLAGQLKVLAIADADQFNYRKKLALIAQSQSDHAAAARWAKEAIWIDVTDPDIHQILAEASRELGDLSQSAKEFRTLRQLQPDVETWPAELVRTLIDAGDRDSAREAVRRMLRDFPNSQRAQALSEEIGAGSP